MSINTMLLCISLHKANSNQAQSHITYLNG
nr:MAG TPA: hypothetical protein [Caudoviricetes sp.]DAR22205.1 MAG TPA: hypothetical protein [Caudoviricetes sp.]